MDNVESFNTPRDLVEHIASTQNNVSMVIMTQHEFKSGKYESKVIVLNDCSLAITTTKIPCKVEQHYNLLNLSSLESKSTNKLSFYAEGKHHSFLISDADRIDSLIIRIIEALAVAFPKVPYEKLIGEVKVEPASRGFHRRQQDMKSRLEKQDLKPCASFAVSYCFMCDYLNQPHLPDVIWDIDTIYMFNNMKELNLLDFDHLEARCLLPIIMALQYNQWFTSLNADGIKLSPEACSAIPTVISTNCCLKEIHLSNLGLRSDFMQRFSSALMSNADTVLVHIDLSSNPIEDKGVTLLSSAITKLPKGLVHLNLSQTGITGRGVNKLSEAFCANRLIQDTLDFLDLSHNSLKGEEVNNLFNFLAQPNALTYLNLMSTDCALDSIFGALQRGCCQKLRHLDLSQNMFISKKSARVSPSCKQFFGSALALQHVNLSNCHLNGEALKSVLLGLGSNPSSTNIELNISGNNLVQEASILEMCLVEISSITSLDLSDNNLNNSVMGIITKLSKNRSIKKLTIGKNFAGMKARSVVQMLTFLTEMIDEEDSVLESLSLAGSKLRGQLTIFINALGTNSSLKELDVSGNYMGDVGARMLAKALQVNTTLQTLYIDQNAITMQGFSDIARALERNFTLKCMPLPLADITMAMKTNPSATEMAIKKIEAILQRNHSPRKFATDQCYRLQQSFLSNELQQIMDKAIVEIQNTANKLESMKIDSEDILEDLTETRCLIKDASNTKQILTKFQVIGEKSSSENSKLYGYLKSVSDKLHNTMEDELKNNIDSMMECSSEQCPTLLENKELQEEASTKCKEKAHIPTGFISDVVLEQLGADIFNKLGEVNLSVATCMSNLLIDGIESALRQNHKKLIHHLREQEKTSASDENKNTEDKHASILRRRNTEEDTDYLDPNLMSATKRKSVMSRRVRPQSAIVHHQVEPLTSASLISCLPVREAPEEHLDEGSSKKQEDDQQIDDVKTKPTSSPVPKPRRKRTSMLQSNVGTGSETASPPLPHLYQKSSPKPERRTPEAGPKSVQSKVSEKADDECTDSTDLTDGSTSSSPFNSRENTPSHEPQKPKFKKSKSSDKGLKLDVSLETAPKLEHLVKNRPKRPKNRPTTHVHSQAILIDVLDNKSSHDEIEGFFSSSAVPELKPVNSSSEKVNSNKSSAKKKPWSPFSVKSTEKSAGFFPKRSQALKSPGASKNAPPVSPTDTKDRSEFKEKPNSFDRSQSLDGSRDDSSQKLEEDKESENVEEPKPRKVGHRLGIGIGGDALMAEMKAKTASKLPVSSKKSDADDHTSGRSLLPPGGNSPSSHSPGNRSVSPGLEEKTKPVPRPRPPPTVPPKPKPTAESKPAVPPVKPDAVEESDKALHRSITTNTAAVSDIDNVGLKKRLSVREKAAALDKNRNECGDIMRRGSQSRERAIDGSDGTSPSKAGQATDGATESRDRSDVVSGESQTDRGQTVGVDDDMSEEVYL